MIFRYGDGVGAFNYGVIKFYGLAKDVPNLPLDGIATSSTFYSIDTKQVYMFEEESQQWYLQ